MAFIRVQKLGRDTEGNILSGSANFIALTQTKNMLVKMPRKLHLLLNYDNPQSLL